MKSKALNRQLSHVLDIIQDAQWTMVEEASQVAEALEDDVDISFVSWLVERQLFELLCLHACMEPDKPDYTIRRSCFHGLDRGQIYIRIRRKPVYFRIHRSTDKKQPFYFTIHSRNHQVLATSETYTTKQSCRRGIQSVFTGSRKGEEPVIKDDS